MDFYLGEALDGLRRELSEFAEEVVTDEVRERHHASGDTHDWPVHREFASRGWVSAAWPREFGGQGRDACEMMVFKEVLTRAGYPRIGMETTSLVGRTIQIVGTEEQKRELIPRITSGEIIISLGYTEPGCGSDLMAAQTRAVRDGEAWVINGQKMFTTNGHLAQYSFVLTRTDPDAPKHAGLTLFLVPIDSEGVEVQPVDTLGGERTNLVYYTDVRVPDAMRVGAVNAGSKVLALALQLEQGNSFYVYLQEVAEAAETWARDSKRIAEPSVRERLGRAAIDAEISKLLAYRMAWMRMNDRPESGQGPMSKLFSSEKLVEHSAELLQACGPEALLPRGQPGSAADGVLEWRHRFSHGTTIYAGTSEVMRSLIAEKFLGLPRSRAS